MKKVQLYWMGLLTLVGFPVAGWFILLWFRENPISVMARSDSSFFLQFLIGSASGLFLGLGAQWVVSRKFMQSIEKKYASLIYRLGLTGRGIILLSFCAGFGEELFFRGAVQPLIGIWITAILFVAIHGYLNPMNWRITLYGLYMTGVIAILGYFTEYFGIWSACFAHTAIDIVLFRYLVRRGKHISSPDIFHHEIQ